MRYSSTLALCFACLFLTIGCGSTPRTLQSVTVSPTLADAQDFPNGQVQFVATGHFNKAPTSVTPFQLSSWLVSQAGIATIDQNGLASCIPGQSGIATIDIAQFGDGPLMSVAKLTCP